MTRARDLGDFIVDGGAPELVVDTTTLVVDSTNNRVGIGTASPSQALDVNGTGNFTAVTAGTLTIDDITINGSTISDAGDLTIDSGGDINLDANGADIKLKDDGTLFGSLVNASGDFKIVTEVADKDLIFRGNDGGSFITALTLDMSEAGAATFNSLVNANKLQVGGTDVITNARQLSNIASIDATTAAAITAGGVGGGGAIELTAASALSAGQPVVVNTSGQAAPVTKTLGTITITTSGAAIEHGISHAEAYDTYQNKLIWIVKNSASNQYVKWGHANIDESTGEYSGQGDSTWLSNANYGASMAISFDPDSSPTSPYFFMALSYPNSNETSMRTIRINPNNNQRQSVSSLAVANNPSTDGSAFALVYDPSLKAHILVTGLAGAANAASVITVFTVSEAGAITNRVQATISNSTGGSGTFYKYPKIATNENGQFVFTLGDSDATTLWAFPMTVTGSIAAGFTITQGTKQAVTTANFQGNANKHNVIYDIQSGKFVFDYRINGPDSSLSVRSGTVSSNAITLHTEVNVATSNVTGPSTLVADKNATSGLFTTGGYNNDKYQYRSITVASNGNITVGSATTMTDANYFYGDAKLNAVPVTGNPALSSYHVFGTEGNGAELKRNHKKISITSDSTKIIGFAAAAINSGAAGDITVVGGVNDQQSGLTTGVKHFALTGGELTTESNDTFAGIALSATKLLVKG